MALIKINNLQKKGGNNMGEQDCNHQESMRVLKGLALEIQHMDEQERLKTLERIVRLEAEGKGNRFWLLVAKCLLAKPELLPKALNLAEAELSPNSNLRYLQVKPQEIVQTLAAPKNNRMLSAFMNLFS
jgi:hypothetical protein